MNLVSTMAQSRAQLSFVTGHSIGGAAATLWKQSVGGSEALSTFGAPPTALATYSKADNTYLKGQYDLKSQSWVATDQGYLLDVFLHEGLEQVDNAAWKPQAKPQPVQGTRYFHKFDPIPGYYFNTGKYSHSVLSAYLHYDTSGCRYSSTFYGRFLCTQQEVTTNTEQAPNFMYYSYTNAVNPFPCAEAAIGNAYKWIADTTAIDLSEMPTTWVPWDTPEACAYQYLATAEAYGEYYAKSYLWSQNEDRSPMLIAMFFSMWGVFWVHSAYPYYPGSGRPTSMSFPSFSATPGMDLEDVAEALLKRE